MTRTPHSGYLSPTRSCGAFGTFDQAERRRAATVGSARLLDALMRFYERRRAA
ncbi:hypothetical protein K7W03_14345 [Sphingobium sp. PNB]|uniref:hypothetical protein n=1 Tax=Sphingobium sp. PNB TaxID=863934 RepID=UPI001CA4435D|nr:hypothetical protein [Sphingobium sp. PNB]MCB4860772.1 hypothetical protein [Sphingobium sp. PNB]